MKKIIHIILFIAVSFSFIGCDKSMVSPEPDFDVNTYTVSDGVDSVGNVVKNVTFNFEGNPDIISFYSGLPRNDYAFKDGRILDYDAINMSFTTTWQFGTQVNQFSVMASTDFNGTHTLEQINVATWTDITSRFVLATNRGSTTPTPSGTANITDLKIEGKPLYIGFKYVHTPVNGTQATWRIRGLSLLGETDLGTNALTTQGTAGWVITNGGPDGALNLGQIETGTVINLRGNNSNTTTVAESWAITKAFNVNREDLGPDRPVNIKRYIDPQMKNYVHTYANPGEYTVAFVAQNSTIKEQRAKTKTLKIKID